MICHIFFSSSSTYAKLLWYSPFLAISTFSGFALQNVNFISIILFQNDRRNYCAPISLKGQCHEIFCFWFFLWISFPPAPECPIRTVSNFFENSQRYSQVKVHHRCQRHRRQICHRCQWHRWQIAAGCNDTGGKFATGINDTGGVGVNDTGGK